MFNIKIEKKNEFTINNYLTLLINNKILMTKLLKFILFSYYIHFTK